MERAQRSSPSRRALSYLYDAGMTLRDEPLTDAALDAVIGFIRRSNPFAQHTWGWDTGRFIDWRWGSNAVRAADDPGWFGRFCRVFRAGGEIRAVAIAEEGGAGETIITGTEEPGVVAEVLARLVDLHAQRDVGLSFEFSDAAGWLRVLFAAAGLRETPGTGHEWEYDLSERGRPATAPDGFAIATLDDDRGRGDYAEIAACIAAAFGSTRDLVPVLVSLEANPMFLPELSVFARSREGRVAAYCRGTVDPASGVCGIDPVCTHPEFQRRGLGRVVVERCFANQRARGGRFSYIGSDSEPAPGTFLYRSLGPSRRTTYCCWARPR
jgi:GNAT superfamily N-acetyltransferase